jgi:hypothetical protein
MTRCLRCGKTIEGLAQFCDVCQEQQRQQLVVGPTPEAGGPLTQREVRAAGNLGLTPALINL